MPKNLSELATMIAKRDGISENEAYETIRDCMKDMESAFMNGLLDEVEDILREDLQLEPDYLDLFIF